MALLREVQLRNSLERVCGPGEAMTPSQRCLHSQRMPQNTEYLDVHVEEIHTLGQRQDGNFSHLCSSFQHWAPSREKLEQNPWIERWIKRNRAEVTREFGFSQRNLSAQGGKHWSDLQWSSIKANAPPQNLFLRRENIPENWTLKLKSSFKAPENPEHIIPPRACTVPGFRIFRAWEKTLNLTKLSNFTMNW